jgi:hypothetical protein
VSDAQEVIRDFLEVTHEIVLATLSTVDAHGRPRSRIVHPIFLMEEAGVARWMVSSPAPLKTAHLSGNPHVALSWWSPAQNVAYADCMANTIEDEQAKLAVWDLFMTTPPPLGYDLRAFGIPDPESPLFMPLRIEPYRVQVLKFQGWEADLTPRIWRAETPERAARPATAGG